MYNSVCYIFVIIFAITIIFSNRIYREKLMNFLLLLLFFPHQEYHVARQAVGRGSLQANGACRNIASAALAQLTPGYLSPD